MTVTDWVVLNRGVLRIDGEREDGNALIYCISEGSYPILQEKKPKRGILAWFYRLIKDKRGWIVENMYASTLKKINAYRKK